MPEQWYWKHGRDLLGPLETEAMAKLIEQRRIADRDQIRLESEEHWLTGAEFKSLFAGQTADGASSAAAARLLSQSARLRESNAVARATLFGGLTGRLGRLFRSAVSPVHGLLDRTGEFAGRCLALLAPLRNRYLVLAVSLLALTVALVSKMHFGSDARNRRVYMMLTQASDDWDALRSRNASPEEIAQFVDSIRPELKHDRQALIDAGKNDSSAWFRSAEREWGLAHTRNALIQANQAFLSWLETPEEARASAPSHAIFQQNMMVARDLLAGLPSSRSTGDAFRTQPERNWWSSPIVVSILIADGLLFVAAAGYWLLRRR